MNLRYSLIIIILLIGFTSCKTASNSKNTKTSLYKDEVFACYYHNKFNGRKTASGIIFSNSKLTAAHKSLTFGTKVKVTNIENNKSVIVEINDRGPFTKGLEIDLSKKAFDAISHDKKAGKLQVKLELINDSKK
ncbi:septal ring lytic transglycosylase RlpA family protein [Paenimyroides viscosum]|uniref:Probable endolytic peptidoglycan transglycosylase RlpA n=1 Tax=Paenimyroides viscosum TaxID=2488729 RepID=A0A3P1AN47_9FLAO|nr:septal ring lytic transglycosylase RlpA family protein [Paenimyroides viscosum]RRA90367.1 septal ring lytic transglycosylase RlpA family protein [Paenimyroides viscosum]